MWFHQVEQRAGESGIAGLTVAVNYWSASLYLGYFRHDCYICPGLTPTPVRACVRARYDMSYDIKYAYFRHLDALACFEEGLPVPGLDDPGSP